MRHLRGRWGVYVQGLQQAAFSNRRAAQRALSKSVPRPSATNHDMSDLRVTSHRRRAGETAAVRSFRSQSAYDLLHYPDTGYANCTNYSILHFISSGRAASSSRGQFPSLAVGFVL